MARGGVLIPTALLALLLAGCGREAAERAQSQARAQPREDAAAASIPLPNVRRDWEANRALPERKGAGPFEARAQAAPVRKAQRGAREGALAAPTPSIPQPPPFAYVGKVARGQIGFAVLVRDERVFVVHAGDIAEGYRVQSVGEREVVVVRIDSGVAQSLAFSSASAANVLPSAPAPSDAADDASAQPSDPGG